jgi:hypothetical protein
VVDLKCACTDVFLEVSSGLYSPRTGQNMAVFYGSYCGQGKEDGVAILHGTVRIFSGSVWLSSMFRLFHVRIVFQLQINPAGHA